MSAKLYDIKLSITIRFNGTDWWMFLLWNWRKFLQWKKVILWHSSFLSPTNKSSTWLTNHTAVLSKQANQFVSPPISQPCWVVVNLWKQNACPPHILMPQGFAHFRTPSITQKLLEQIFQLSKFTIILGYFQINC